MAVHQAGRHRGLGLLVRSYRTNVRFATARVDRLEHAPRFKGVHVVR